MQTLVTVEVRINISVLIAPSSILTGEFLTVTVVQIVFFTRSAPALRRVRHSDIDDLRRPAAEAMWTSKKTTLGEHISGVRVYCPAGTSARRCAAVMVCPGGHPDEAVVEGKTMSNGVLPATPDV